MRRLTLLAAAAAVTLAGPAFAPSTLAAPVIPSPDPGAKDPYGQLEDIHAPAALDWVKGENARTADRLEKDPRFEDFREAALKVLTSKDRIPEPHFLGEGVGSFWQDADHVKGVWRRTSLADFATSAPHWETLIDFDALSKAEGRNLIFKGASCLPPGDQLCLVRISDGGGDAVEVREFDTGARSFVKDGFLFSAGKQEVEFIDKDTVLVARDFGDGTLTRSGYPFVLKTLKRGQSLAAAVEIYRGEPSDVRVGAAVLRDAESRAFGLLIERSDTFFTRRYLIKTGDGAPTALSLPAKVSFEGNLGKTLVFAFNEDFAGPAGATFKAGDLVALDLATSNLSLIARPTSTQSFASVFVTRSRVVVQLLDMVNGALDVHQPGKDGWTTKRVDLPKGLAVYVRAGSEASDTLFVNTESFLDPPSQWRVEAGEAKAMRIRSLPPLFDASALTFEQHFAVSTDGTRIPYFLVHRKDMKRDGKTPVQMFGYGGFLVSETPSYRPELGKLWLGRGGAYVLTNIRGGGEFGPAWHEAALREHRQRAFDDFASVARDLIATGVTSPAHLGVYGRSNGGVLTSVSITQHPELFNAAVIESPLVDMLRYTHLSAGASWAAEYGDPDVPGDRAFIAAYSAYTRLAPGRKYPEPYITTNTEDDRVHPGHARKLAAALQGLGYSALYFENTFGGHANDADPELNARRWARHYVYLSQKLMDAPK
jgi:prolyl oligopeptidase